MSTTTTTHETVADAKQENIVFERSGSYYGYLGQDGEGHHHHVDKVTNTVYVAQRRADRFLPEGAALYWFRVCGEIDHVEEFEKYDDRGVSEWVAYVDSVRGWTDRPLNLGQILDEVLTNGGGFQ